MRRGKAQRPIWAVCGDNGRVFSTYRNLEWAEHSAECFTIFFGTPVNVINAETRAVVCTKFAK